VVLKDTKSLRGHCFLKMIRLKQKKAEEEKKAADEKSAADVSHSQGSSASSSSTTDAKDETGDIVNESNSGSGGLKLLGIGGRGARSGNVVKSAGKKRTPGEIRIQKG
jgi:hypothetical protein